MEATRQGPCLGAGSGAAQSGSEDSGSADGAGQGGSGESLTRGPQSSPGEERPPRPDLRSLSLPPPAACWRSEVPGKSPLSPLRFPCVSNFRSASRPCPHCTGMSVCPGGSGTLTSSNTGSPSPWGSACPSEPDAASLFAHSRHRRSTSATGGDSQGEMATTTGMPWEGVERLTCGGLPTETGSHAVGSPQKRRAAGGRPDGSRGRGTGAHDGEAAAALGALGPRKGQTQRSDSARRPPLPARLV